MKAKQELRTRLAELDAAIAAAPCWGAAISVREEERAAIKREIEAIESFEHDRQFAQLNME